MTDFPPASQSRKTRFIILGSVLVGAALLTTSIACSLLGGFNLKESGPYTLAFAFLVCWLSATISLVITAYTSNTPSAVSGLFLAIAVRTGFPLLLGFAASAVGPLAGTEVFGLVLVHYLVGLFVETLVAVKLVAGNPIKTTVG